MYLEENTLLTYNNSLPIDFPTFDFVDSKDVREEAALGRIHLLDRPAGQHVGNLLIDHLVGRMYQKLLLGRNPQWRRFFELQLIAGNNVQGFAIFAYQFPIVYKLGQLPRRKTLLGND